LIAYYPFNGTGGDESGNGYNLSVKGAIMTTNRFGQIQKATNSRECKLNCVKVFFPPVLPARGPGEQAGRIF